MAGHSKWNNIKRKKEKTDKQKANVFTKIGREIMVAAKEGGPDLAMNPKLSDAVAKAKANNVPNDNIERAIKRATSLKEGTSFEEIVYEGFGPSGVAVMIEALTDNRNRTASEVRHGFDKFGGSMGQTGSVSYQFSRQGVLLIERSDIDEDTIMESALEAGASDFITEDEVYDIRTELADFSTVRKALEGAGYTFASAQLEYVPSTSVVLDKDEDIEKMTKMLDFFEDNDDIQNVYHNWENMA